MLVCVGCANAVRHNQGANQEDYTMSSLIQEEDYEINIAPDVLHAAKARNLPTNKPPHYDWYVMPNFYKTVGSFGHVFWWDDGIWRRSTKDIDTLYAEILEEIFSVPCRRITAGAFIKRINANLIINEYRALVNKHVHKMTNKAISEKMEINANTAKRYIERAEYKLGKVMRKSRSMK